MASFTSVGDTTSLVVRNVGETLNVALSGTYNMTILLQKEKGSPGSGAWETVKTYTAANATVSDNFTNTFKDTNFRLIVSVDTSGTCVAVLSETNDRTLATLGEKDGSPVVSVKDSGVSVAGGVKEQVKSLTSATYTFDAETYANRRLLLDASGGIDITLPAATGTGDVYEFYVVTATTDLYAIISAGSDKVYGTIVGGDDPGDEFTWVAVPGTDNRVKLGGTAQASGGSIGDHVVFTDIGAAKWAVRGHITQGGTEATPFASS